MKSYILSLLKYIAILYSTILYSIFGLGITQIIDKYIYYDADDINLSIDKLNYSKKNNNYNNFKLLFEIVIIISIISIVSFAGCSIIKLIPFPLNNIYGFNYYEVNEVTSGVILSISMMTYCNTLSNKIKRFKKNT